MTAPTRKHFLISNAAFSRMAGVRKVCMDCGAPDPPRNSECPGRRIATLIAREFAALRADATHEATS